MNGTPHTFPYISNTTVTTVGGACGSSIGDSATISVAITGASTQNGTGTCTAGTWTYTPATALSADGAYSITATQADASANTGTTGAKAISVDAHRTRRHAHDGQRHRPDLPAVDQRRRNVGRRHVRHRIRRRRPT